jgi:hypothetical protein
MPRDGAITFGDLIGKLDTLRLECIKCGRAGRYSVQRLIDSHGPDGKLIEWLANGRPITHGRFPQATGACCPDLPKVL